MMPEAYSHLLICRARDSLVRGNIYACAWRAVDSLFDIKQCGLGITFTVEMNTRSLIDDIIVFQALLERDMFRNGYVFALHLEVQNEFITHPTALDRVLFALNPTESL